MSKFGNIFLSWRKGTGSIRHLVGVIKINATHGATFQYLKDNLAAAEKEGFTSYTEFPDVNKTYSENVLDIFQQRLFKSERSDYIDFLNFWGIDKIYKDDTAYLLAHTHGMVPTDNFEFLANFKVTRDLRFVSEIAGLSHLKIEPTLLKVGDELVWRKNPTKYDSFQVNLFTKDNVHLGCVKKIHSKVFYDKRAQEIKIQVKEIERNGTLKRAFIEIYI